MLTAEQEKEMREMESEVDITLIRWMLSLTPLERLRIGQQYAASAWRLKNAYQPIQLRADSKRPAKA